MNITDIKDKVTNEEEKVTKIKVLIEKTKMHLDKKKTILDKILDENNLNFCYDDVKENPSWFYDFQYKPYYHELYWARCDVEDKEESIKNNEIKLKKANDSLKNWQEKLRLEEVKNQYIQDNIPQIIKDFLLDWKARVSKWYLAKKDTFIDDRKAHYEQLNVAYFRDLIENPELIRNSRDKDKLSNEYDPSINYKSIAYYNRERCRRANALIDEFNSQYDSFFLLFYNHDLDEEWLDKQLTEEMNNKLIDLMTRVSKVTGEILDASNLTLSDSNLNGLIVGKDGTANVETIGAGGYNNKVLLDSGRHGQCYHFRTLIKPYHIN